MHNRSTPALCATYFSVLALSLGALAFGLMMVMQASAGLASSGTQEKTSLQMQIESSREIKQALATPVSVAPLPPITARLARKSPASIASNEAWKIRSIPAAALNAMAMNDSTLSQSIDAPQPSRASYPLADLHGPQ